VIAARDLAPAQLDSVLGRTSPVLKLVVALVWLIGLATTNAWGPPIVLALAAVASALTIGRVPSGDLGRALAPLWIAALGLVFFNTVFGVSNADPTATTAFTLGPWRVTEEAIVAGIGVGLRVVAIAAVGAVFALTTDSTRLVDALVQQARVPERFAYGALAAYGAIPRFGSDLADLRAARRMRGLRGSWHPRILVGLLVLAIRHGDRMALAMDARAFGSGPRSRYRNVSWGWLDLVVGVVSIGVLAAALATGGSSWLSP
jgi:energy-coupling factor transport system permease protein